MLGISIAQAEADLNELVEAALIERNDEGQIKFPDMTEQVGRLTDKREAARKRVDEYREKSKKQPSTRNSDTGSQDNRDSNTLPAACNNTNDDCNNHVTRYERTSKEEKSKEEKSKVKKSKDVVVANEKQNPPTTPPPPDSEQVKLWRQWAKAQKIAPTFADRINETVNDLEAWKETLVFGAKYRKIPHSNAGLDWALQNYLQNISKREAELVAPPQQKNEKPVMSMGKKLAG